MPLFYLKPFDFHADKKDIVPVVEFNVPATMLVLLVGMALTVLAVALLIRPALMALIGG